jgi:hypothetical protein
VESVFQAQQICDCNPIQDYTPLNESEPKRSAVRSFYGSLALHSWPFWEDRVMRNGDPLHTISLHDWIPCFGSRVTVEEIIPMAMESPVKP